VGLFNRLLTGFASALGLRPHEPVRRYEVTLFGEPLGTFELPTGTHLAHPRALVRPVLTGPFLVDVRDEGAEYYFLYWAEPYPDGRFKTVMWRPTPEERGEAKRFFDVAHGLLPDGTPDPARQPPLPTRTEQETQLIRAVLANREDENAYRAYAEWLTAKGDAYGDYIRLTWEIEKLPDGSPHREQLKEQRKKILWEHGPQWVLPLANLGLYPGVLIGDSDTYNPGHWFNAKGVIEELELPSATRIFPTNAAQLFSAAPFLRELSITNPDLTVADFATVPQMVQIESLRLRIGAGTSDDYRRFAESPYLTGLRALNLGGRRLTGSAVGSLARAGWLAGVRELDLSAAAIDDDGAEALAESPNVVNLTTLELSNNDMTDRGLVALCRSPHLANLVVLELQGGFFTARGVSELATASFARTLTTLNLNSCQVDAEGAQGLAAGSFPALKTLALWWGSVGAEGFSALVAAPWFSNLEQLFAGGNGVGDAGARALAATGSLALRELDLGDNQITDVGVVALVRSRAVTGLKRLDLRNNPFGLPAVKALAETDLPALEELDLSRADIGRTGAQALAASPCLKNLKRLTVSEEFVGLIGREALMKRFTKQVVVRS
jgi:uncharacterized protein (TIGR02996 family)